MQLPARLILMLWLFSIQLPVDAKPSPVSTKFLKISLKTRYKGTHVKKQWVSVCRLLGTSLSRNKGVWGFGIYEKYSCYFGKKRVAGKKEKKPLWFLDIIDLEKKAEARLFYKPQGSLKRILQSRVILTPSSQNLIYLADSEVAEMLAWEILDALPMVGILNIKENKHTYLDGFHRYRELPDPPQTLDIVSVSYSVESKEWITKTVGKASYNKKETKKSNDITLKEKAKEVVVKIKRKKPVKYQWDVKIGSENLDAKQTFYIQDSLGAKANQRQIHESLEQAISKFYRGSAHMKQALFKSFANGYGGMRLGLPFFSGEDLLKKVTLIGFFTEIRKGAAKGLRFYMDMAPKVKDGKYFFGWSRYTLGWSVGLELNSILKRVDVIPKIGILNLDSYLGVPASSDTSVKIPTSFVVKSASSFGLELSLEMISTWLLIRGWVATDQAGLIDLTGIGSVSSIRAGIDTYWDMAEVFDSFEISVVGFIMSEKMQIGRSIDKKEVASVGTEFVASGVTYSLAIVGTGITVSW